MYPCYGLSETEYKIMQLFWTKKTALPFGEILHYCNDTLHLDWAVGTAQTYLNRLIMKGVLKTDNKRYRKSYSAQFSEEELAQRHAQQFLNESFAYLFNVVITLVSSLIFSGGNNSAFVAVFKIPTPIGLVKTSTSPVLALLFVRISFG